MDRNLK